MNDQELKNLWRGQKLEGVPAMAAGEQIAAMRKRMAQLHRELDARDFRDLAGGAGVIIGFAICFVMFPYPLARIGALLAIGGAAFASWKVIQSWRSVPEPIADTPVTDWLKLEVAKVQQETKLLRTPLWWYLLPFCVGPFVVVWGLPNLSVASSVALEVFTAVFCVGGYWLNQRARRKQLFSLRRELESLLQAAHAMPGE